MDSKPVGATPGKTLTLTVEAAADARSAAQIYPANYWFSLMQIPPRTDFPITTSGGPSAHFSQDPDGNVVGGPRNQEEWLYLVRRCQECHQMGDKATREIAPSLGRFDSSITAWDRRVKSGQKGPFMNMILNQFSRRRALTMFAAWTDRVAAGKVPLAPSRPQGLERNVVLTEWEWGKGSKEMITEVVSTDKRNPMVDAKGKTYGASEGRGSLVMVDPNSNGGTEVEVPARIDPRAIEEHGERGLPSTRADIDKGDGRKRPHALSDAVDFASPYFGKEIIWPDSFRTAVHDLMMDQRGRVWVTSAIRAIYNPSFCKEGSGNPYAENYPLSVSSRQVTLYNPETKKWTLIDTCFTTHHLQFARDKDNTLYFSGEPGVVGWIDTKILDETGNEQAAQGWCPAYFDTKGNGKFDPNVDEIVTGFPFGIAVNPVDGSVWLTAIGMPGKIVRIDRGSNPPGTCRTETYQPPYKVPGKTGFYPRGIDFDTNGVVWTALAGSGQLASFDRRKCSAQGVRTVTERQCPEGWTLYKLPGPTIRNAPDSGSADFAYYNWVDQFDTLGLGKNVPIAVGSNSDSLLVLDPSAEKWIVLRVPYPLGFYSRGLDGRIDDPKIGWKGRGLWATYSPVPVWHMEGGTAASSMLVHFQIRPSPLAH